MSNQKQYWRVLVKVWKRYFRVADARSLLTDEFTRQLQQDFGLDPKTGEVTDLSKLSHLDDRRLETARVLRGILTHYLASEMGSSGKKAQRDVMGRIVREQAFTVLNRLAALRMMLMGRSSIR